MKLVRKISYGLAAFIAVAPMAVLAFDAPADAAATLPGGTITNIATSIMKWLLIIVGILAIVGFVISGILYLTAAGDEDQIAKAKRAMIYSIIGVIVALLGVVIITAVNSMLGGASDSF